MSRMQSFFVFLLFFVLPHLSPYEINGGTHVDSAAKFVGICETNGANRSAIIDKWNRAVRAPMGSPYCASAVSAWLTLGNVTTIAMRSARARAFISHRAIDAGKVLRGEVQIERGDVIIWQRNGGGHIGIAYENWKGTRGKVIEANTSNGRTGSQWNGDGVWIRSRAITPRISFRITHILKVRNDG